MSFHDTDEPTDADPTLPDGARIRIYEHGGIDVLTDDGKWITVASNPECCRTLATILIDAANGAVGEEPRGCCGEHETGSGQHDEECDQRETES